MKLRLNENHRNRLRALVRELVTAPKEEAALNAAYTKAAAAVKKTVEKALPLADMRVLKKYDKSAVDDRINLNLSAGGYVVFKFNDGAGPLSIRHRVFNADEPTTAAFNVWDVAREAHEKAIKVKQEDYYSLIAQARYFEDVVEVWPEAERLRSSFGGNAVIAFSPEIVARIRADVRTRARAAA